MVWEENVLELGSRAISILDIYFDLEDKFTEDSKHVLNIDEMITIFILFPRYFNEFTVKLGCFETLIDVFLFWVFFVLETRASFPFVIDFYLFEDDENRYYVQNGSLKGFLLLLLFYDLQQSLSVQVLECRPATGCFVGLIINNKIHMKVFFFNQRPKLISDN